MEPRIFISCLAIIAISAIGVFSYICATRRLIAAIDILKKGKCIVTKASDTIDALMRENDRLKKEIKQLKKNK